jgi:hypothetical protein
MTYQYSFKEILDRAERINWRVEDLIGGEKTLDFSRVFMPESLARTEALRFLSASEKRTLNQIRGHAYLSIFGLVEEFILPFVLDQARPDLSGDDHTRALLKFASEEAKHIQLFRAFREEFAKGFGTVCDVIGPPEAIAKQVLSHPPLSVALVTHHIEWMTQRHFVEAVRDNGMMDPCFKDLLKHHWMEEMQHAELDALMIEGMALRMTPADIKAGIEGYWAIGGFLDGGLEQQTLFDLAALERATGRTFTLEEGEQFIEVQRQANRWTYLGSGMSHPKFVEMMGMLDENNRQALMEAVPMFS